MDELRLILLGLGLLVIAGIYLWGMRARIRAGLEARRRRRAARASANEPVLDNDQDLGIGSVDPTLFEASDGEANAAWHGGEPSLGEVTDPDSRAYGVSDGPTITEAPQMTVILTVLAPKNQPFQGIRILEVAQAASLRFNARQGTLDMLCDSDDDDPRLFRIAHLREPGVFEPDTVQTLATPGLLMFMELPGPLSEVAAVDRMLATARHLAQQLGGMICDQHHNRMTPQAVEHLRGEAAELERRRRVWEHRPIH